MPTSRSELALSIVVCEPQCWGLEHAHVNASVLDTVLAAYPDARVTFYGESGHMRHVRAVLEEYDSTGSVRVQWKAVEIPARATVGWRRLMREFSWARVVLSNATPERAAVLLCSITGPGIVAVKSVMYAAKQRVPVLAIMHSVLRTVFDRQSLRPSTWIVNMRHAMALPHPERLRYVTLGEPIHRNLVAMLPKAGRRFTSIDMPYLMHDLPPIPEGDPRPHGKTRFGFIGVGNAVKRFGLYVRLASEVTTRIPDAVVEFTLVGYLPRAEGQATASPVTGTGSSPLMNDEYRRRTFELTYVVATADPAHYHLIASATFLDSLAFGKPGIFLRSPYLDHYFGLMGDIGYLCDGYNEMLETVEAITREFPAARYRDQCRNIRRGRGHFAPQQLAARMREIMVLD